MGLIRTWVAIFFAWGSLYGWQRDCRAQGIEASIFYPRGEFLLIREEQFHALTGELCIPLDPNSFRGWVKRELYRLRVGAPRPSVVSLRRQAGALIEWLGGEVVFEGRCRTLAQRGDPRGQHVILVGRVPGFGGDLYIEVWPWEEGEELFVNITSFCPLEDPGR